MNINKNCDTPCLDSRPDSCIYWGGESIPELGIEKGMCYPLVMANLVNAFMELINSKVTIDDREVSAIEAVQVLSDKVGGVKTSDISIGDGTLGVSNFTSQEAVALTGVKMKYNLTPTKDGSTFSLDTNELLSSLPSGYQLTSSRTVLHGKPVSGNSVVIDSGKPNFSIDIAPNRYPITGETRSRIKTPNGEVVLKKEIYLPSVQSEDISTPFEIEDRVRSAGEVNNLEGLLNSITSEVRNVKSYVDTLKNVNIGDLKNKDIKTVVAATKGEQTSQKVKTDSLEKTTSEVANSTNSEIENLKKELESTKASLKEVEDLKTELESLKGIVSNIGGSININR